MKKMMAVFLIFLMMISTVPVLADNISVYLDGQRLEFDVPPQLVNGRTMVPMRKIFESLGAAVSWDDPSQTATGKKGDTIINITIDSKTLFKNGVPKVLDVAPALIDGRTLVPARAIAESFDCKVEWVEESQSVHIFSTESGNLTKTVLNASEISEKVAPSVVYIAVMDADANIIGTGSGFFLTADGVVVTNYHVIEDSYYAAIVTISGNIYEATSVIAYDEEMDVAVLRVSKTDLDGNSVSGFPAVTTADSDAIKAGQRVYALGNPQGLRNTISDGIISNVSQVVDGDTYIQITAPISSGSSGGALVNEYGEVIGITAAGITAGENLGFAIPINVLSLLTLDAEGMPYLEFAQGNNAFYLDLYPEVLELEVGQSEEVLVYAEGKGDDWSIYWHADRENVVRCQWEDWLEDYPSVCPLVITGLKAGTATVTIYSDVDFQGKTVTVRVKNPPIRNYPNSDIPDYTAVTGVPLKGLNEWMNSVGYIYSDYHVNAASTYVNYLLENGFSYYATTSEGGIPSYYYVSPGNQLVSVSLAADVNEVWIIIAR